MTSVTRKGDRMPASEQERSDQARRGGRPDASWRLQDAKARFSEVVRLAREYGPQRVTVHGHDAVVIMAADAYDRLQPPFTGEAIVEALQHSPLGEVEIERTSVKGQVREVEL
jgi:antitoxin Phd